MQRRSSWRALERVRWAELRTTATGVDPGWMRLRLASAAVVSMLCAVGLAAGLTRLGGPGTALLIIAAALSMVATMAVNEPEVRRLRVTTALMALPAAAGITVGALLSPHRVLVDVVFVLVMASAVWVRRYGPRGFALGMGAVMGCFFALLLGARAPVLGWLLAAGVLGIASTVGVRGFLFAESPARTVARLVRAFRARLHAVVGAVAELLDADEHDVEHARRAVGRHRTRLNDTALLIADYLDRQAAPDELGPYVLDAELSAERLTDTTRYLVRTAGRPADALRLPLLHALHALAAATATGPKAQSPALLEAAQRRVEPLVASVDGLGDDGQRVAFAVARLAAALTEGRRHLPTTPADAADPAEHGPRDRGDPQAERAGRPALQLSTRQAAQVGVATALAIVAGELLSPARWYWAVIAAFVVFAGTTSRGDVLARGVDRIVGTVGGVVAGMALAFLVDGAVVPTVVLLFGCVFLTIFSVRVSPGLLAFWITAVLALLYGLTGQFSVGLLVVRIEETAVGAVLGMLSGYLVLPAGTRDAFGEALDAVVDAAHAVLDAAFGRMLGGRIAVAPVELAREMDGALKTLRERARPLDNPLFRRRGRSSYSRAIRVLAGVDHYARLLARLSDTVRAPDWAPTVTPAVERVRCNLDGLRALLLHVDGHAVVPAEPEIDAAEAAAARHPDPALRGHLLTAARLLRRMDQTVVGFAQDLGAPSRTPVPGQSAR